MFSYLVYFCAVSVYTRVGKTYPRWELLGKGCVDGIFPEPDIIPVDQNSEPERRSCSENSTSVNEQNDDLPFTFSKLESLISETAPT